MMESPHLNGPFGALTRMSGDSSFNLCVTLFFPCRIFWSRTQILGQGAALGLIIAWDILRRYADCQKQKLECHECEISEHCAKVVSQG